MRKKIFCMAVLAALAAFGAAAQIQTAGSFFQELSNRYAGIYDMEAKVTISIGKTYMTGQLSYKRPNLLRIDFTKPQNQVIAFNGDLLTIYLPGSSAVLNQSVSGNSGSLSKNGLQLLSSCYSVSYESGRAPVPLESGSSEMVVNLMLYRKTSSEAFRSIKMSVNPNSKLIRRMEATTPQGEKYIFTFYDYNLNSGIPGLRFVYDAPTSANNYNNFLSSE